MDVLGRHEAGNYSPEDGILVVRDAGAGIGDDELSDNGAHPVGTMARSGRGWLYASGGDGPCVVHLQALEARPDDEDLDAWSDVVEVPYESLRGVVELSSLTTPGGDEHLRLREPGMYRVRVAHRLLPPSELPDDEDDLQPTDLWQLDFWHVDAVEPPQWFRRRRPPVAVPDPGWTSLLGFQEIEVANVVEWAGRADGMSVDEINTWGAAHYRGPNWLDQPLRSSQTRPGWPSVADIARQVGIGTLGTRGDLLPLYVALRILTFDGMRYVAIDDKPMAQDVLRLPGDVVTFLEASQAVRQFTAYAADLVSVALWGGTQQTVASLADRTLAGEDEVRATLRYAGDRKLLQVEQRSPDELVLTPQSRRLTH
ncbi:hypothetical protein AB0I34_07990 [Kribbella sp. NPDC050281]|uniref:hypothetical protein n=1 Tax=Kribbella sp. NPDC050281 TaxID=3155515 RepID=UPI0033E264EA